MANVMNSRANGLQEVDNAYQLARGKDMLVCYLF